MLLHSSWYVVADYLSAESVEGLALTLEGVHDVHGRDSLAASVLRVGHGVTDDVLEEDLEHTTGLFVNETRDTLGTTTTSKTADSGLGNAHDGLLKGLLGSETLGTGLAALAFSALRP